MRKSLHQLPAACLNALAWIAGVAAAGLPKRWWPVLDPYVPASDSAGVAAIVTILAGAAIGVPGFIGHATEQVSRNNRAILDAATDQAARPPSSDKISDREWGRTFVTASGLSLFTFIFLTPAGWASTYLGISGVWRAVAAAVDDPFGDPLLTGLDSLFLRTARRGRAHIARRRRESLEGPEVPDRILRGSQVGTADTEVVIVSSRRKAFWDAGTVVDAGDRWYRVIGIEERTIQGRLRTLYRLNEHRDHEVFRRPVRYDIPLKPDGVDARGPGRT
jgi:hypothetical protein